MTKILKEKYSFKTIYLLNFKCELCTELFFTVHLLLAFIILKLNVTYKKKSWKFGSSLMLQSIMYIRNKVSAQ